MKKLLLLFLIFVIASCNDSQNKTNKQSLIETQILQDAGGADSSKSQISQCPVGMIFVEGDFCPTAQVVCKRWVDSLGNTITAPDDSSLGRCGEFVYPTKCLVAKVHKKFCIDVYEYPNVPGQRPQSWMTWYDVKAACQSQGKRLCTKSEWTFACEGPDIHPYPYGDGYHRDKFACNFDNSSAGDINVMKATSKDAPMSQRLDEMLTPSGAMTGCVSPFGVHDMVGNIDEFVVNESGMPYASGLVGGHIFGVRNACRPMTMSHNENFSWYETGGRCCL